METQKFKTTINCSGCVAKVTPALNAAIGEGKWEVNTQNPDKILSVTAADTVTEEQIVQAVKKVGFKAERID